MDSSHPTEIAWDLSELYSGPEDVKIEGTINMLRAQTEEFVTQYKNRIDHTDFTPEKVFQMIRQLEKIKTEFDELSEFASLNFAANMSLPENQKLNSIINDFKTEIHKKLAFVDLELGGFLTKYPQTIQDPQLSEYRHYLERILRNFPHTLTEIEEQLILEKDQFGINAWAELQSTWLNTRKFDIEIEGNKKSLSYGEANGLLGHPDRKTRESANRVIYANLGKDHQIFASALRNIFNDWMKISSRRHFPTPLEQSLSASDTDFATIEHLMQSVEDHIPLYRKYLKMKAKIMELPKLGCHDIVAPIPGPSKTDITWKEAKDIVSQAYSQFDERFATYVSDMLERSHVDASPRFGKRNGAFCSSWYKGKSAFILTTFTKDVDSLYTLTHELGHAVHAYLNSRKQSILNTNISMCVAEIASIFGELLLTDMLLKQGKTNAEKISLLCNVLDTAGMVVFQVSSRFWFENSLYTAIDKGEYLDGDKIAQYWCQNRNKVYGDVVDWFDEMRWEWAMKPHYFIPNFRFYNYPYVFAQLFVFALFKIYKSDPKAFIPKFIQMLEAGSSLSTHDIGKIIGMDLSSAEFWSLGMAQIQDFIQQLDDLL